MTVPQVVNGTDGRLLQALHDAFRRDADHLARAVEQRAVAVPERAAAVRWGWAIFARQLRAHHAAQDAYLWPVVRGYLLARPEESALVDAMEAEHARIEQRLAAVDGALYAGDVAWLADAAARFREDLLAHLRHEEDAVVPLLHHVLDPRDWRSVAAAERKAGREDSEFLPYVLADAPPDVVELVTRTLSAPTRWLLHHRWQPRFAATRRW